TRFSRDWSSDVCSSDLRALPLDEEHDDDLQSIAEATTVASVSDHEDSDRSGSEAEAEQRRSRAAKRNNPRKKQLAFEERFACNQIGRASCRETARISAE